VALYHCIENRDYELSVTLPTIGLHVVSGV
jgi:hypothetical protein